MPKSPVSNAWGARGALSMHRVSAASENLDGSRVTARSFERPGRLNDGTEFSTTRSGRFSASVAFSYLTMNVANLLKRRPRAAHDQVHQAPHWYQVKHTGVHGGTSPPSSSAADLPPEEWVVRGGTTPWDQVCVVHGLHVASCGAGFCAARGCGLRAARAPLRL